MVDRLRGSILLHLALSFAVGILVLVAGAGYYLESSMRRAVYGQITKDILDAAKVTLHRIDEDKTGLDKELLDLPDNVFLRVMDPDGKVLLESRELATLAPQERQSDPRKLEPWVWREIPRGPGVRLKVATFPCTLGWVEVVRDMHPEEGLLRDFRKSLLVLLGVIPFLAAGLGYALVRLAFAPLRQLMLEADGIRPESLDQRLDLRSLPLELHPLAEKFNGVFDRLQRAYANLAELNTDMAHELRNPLHALRLEVEGLLLEEGLPERAQDTLAGIGESLEHLSRLAEQMLFLARVEDPGHHLDRRPVELARLLALAKAPFEALAEERGITLAVDAPEDAQVEVDRTLMVRAIHNLLSNALRHAPEGSTVELEGRVADAGLSIEIRDGGEGVSEEVLARLGSRFVRGDGLRDRGSGGTGLGLAMVVGILKLHGGSLELRNLAAGGAAARITLPPT